MVDAILKENDRRLSAISADYNPLTGKGVEGERFPLNVFETGTLLHIPVAMTKDRLVGIIKRHGSIEAVARDYLRRHPGEKVTVREVMNEIVLGLSRERSRHDFPFWAACFVKIKRKGGGDDVSFILNRPQRRLVSRFEEMRLDGRPIRLILLKARQWGGSTCAQLYMAWLQLVHCRGLNSLIIAHQGTGSDEIKDMFDRMMASYPLYMLLQPGDKLRRGEKKTVGVGKSGSIMRVPRRNCKIKIGTAERPDSCRGGDYNLVHLSEVGIWKSTDGKRPEDIVRSACSGILLRPMTMIVLESTANGTGNFFHREYLAALEGESQFEPMFVPWYEIEQYSLPFPTEGDREAFAAALVEGRSSEVETPRSQSGAFLWRLWEKGATLEALHWYTRERSKYSDHAAMAAEYPSDEIEAFAHSGRMVFDAEAVEALRPGCMPPLYVGELVSPMESGVPLLGESEFIIDSSGLLKVWDLPGHGEGEEYSDRYLTVVDIGGRSTKSDWTVITVFDRLLMAEGGPPVVAAQWRGHADLDIVAMKAAEIAAFYSDSLLVIESNTVETRSPGNIFEGYTAPYIMTQLREIYPNLYARSMSPEDISAGKPKKYGFHTNISTKPMVVAMLVRAVREHLYVERDDEALNELLRYEQRQDGSYAAISGAHDDILMTRAIGLYVCFHEMDIPKRRGPGCNVHSRGTLPPVESTFS